MSAPRTSAPHVDAALNALWRARALRYMLIYLLLACVLVTLRYQTQHIYPDVRALRAERSALQQQRDELSLVVQTLTSEQRVREWAIQNGMVPYAQAPKQTQAFSAAPRIPAVSLQPLPTRVEVKTTWK
ncbi:hypothetical protein [Deinococcus ruber]|uniref:Uncharacterized protein n=1 Tax=Deinococcus ruber TaxID=1848197 RepID=A0A918EZC5_9DEIO|nr:hypothetical protein [Deinococcus ruber]GGQ93405.1 hypothetical protein GCM10008957_01750 [Deinococcus ruber]